jgi:hypothetical protein
MSVTTHNLPSVGLTSLDETRAALIAHGIEVSRVEQGVIALAVRVRSHLMDAGVSVQVEPAPEVQFTVRAQGSDFPGKSDAQLFAKVREAADHSAHAHGFSESGQQSRELLDPGDASRVLDTWYELTYAKPVSNAEDLLIDVRWALSVPKCV